MLLHEQLVPYVRAAAATAARTGLPIIRPLCLTDPADPRGWTLSDAYGYGPALWVAPVLDDGAREREVALPRGDWIETWSGRRVRGGGEATCRRRCSRSPSGSARARSSSRIRPHTSRPASATSPSQQRPLEATLWGEPRLGRTATRLADGTRIAWRDGVWSVEGEREIRFSLRVPER